MGRYLELQLRCPEAGLCSAGVPVHTCGKDWLVFANLKILLGDGDGIRMALEWNGQGGVKPCFRHPNVFKKPRAGEAARAMPPDHVDITSHEPSRFKVWEQGEVYHVIDAVLLCSERVARGELPKARLQEMVEAFGFRPTPNGLLANAALRECVDIHSVTRFDWVHTCLSDGVLSTATWILISAAESAEIATQADLNAFLAQPWGRPKTSNHFGRSLKRIFDDWSAHKNTVHGKVLCSASEMLSLYTMVRLWVETRLPTADPRLGRQVALFLSACYAVDSILEGKRQRVPMAEAARSARRHMIDHMRVLKDVCGISYVRPKHHWAFDVCDQIEADKCVMDAFTLERLHLRVRQVADKCFTLSTYEATVLAGVINLQADRAARATCGRATYGRTTHLRGIPGVLVSDTLSYIGIEFAVGEYVQRAQLEVGFVVACAFEGQTSFLIVDELVKVDSFSRSSGLWRPNGARSVWTPEGVDNVAAWLSAADGNMLIAFH